ncbi:MAG: glycosyltransferase family 2 protein [Chloroflexales bacterium]
MSKITISIVLPVRNRAGSIASEVAECMAIATQQCDDYEIILVDDGSNDGTREQVDHLAAAYAPVMVLHQPVPRGYAAALRMAWQVARGDYILAASLAGPTGLAELPRLLAARGESAVVVGYRTPAPRSPITAAYAAAVRAALGSNMRDPALRLALFRSDLAGLLPDMVPDGLAHPEIYARASRAGMPVTQVAVAGRRGRDSFTSTAMIELVNYSPPSAGSRQSALMGAMTLAVVGGFWLLRRSRRP